MSRPTVPVAQAWALPAVRMLRRREVKQSAHDLELLCGGISPQMSRCESSCPSLHHRLLQDSSRWAGSFSGRAAAPGSSLFPRYQVQDFTSSGHSKRVYGVCFHGWLDKLMGNWVNGWGAGWFGGWWVGRGVGSAGGGTSGQVCPGESRRGERVRAQVAGRVGGLVCGKAGE